jgi:hypothetical protein
MRFAPFESAMRRFRRRKIATAPVRGWRFAAALLAMLTFTVSSFVTQTHIHFDMIGSGGIVTAMPDAPHGKHPFKETPANCPICQEIAMAGHYVTPGAAVLALPTQSVSIVPIVIAVRFIVEAVSHDWHGRAPPQH